MQHALPVASSQQQARPSSTTKVLPELVQPQTKEPERVHPQQIGNSQDKAHLKALSRVAENIYNTITKPVIIDK